MRIVSLLPSATEIICGLGLRDQLVGVTHECDYPAGVSDLPKVTRTLIPHDATSGQIDTLVRERLQSEKALYALDMPVLQSLRPDLIVTQALCDVCAVAESEVQAAARSLPEKPQVINLEPACLADVFECIRQVGIAAGIGGDGVRSQLREAPEGRLRQLAPDPITVDAYLESLQRRVDAVAKRSESIRHRPSVMLLEWIDPPFCAGHWSPELVALAGGREAIGVAGQRSVTTAWDDIVAADPEVLMIACCGFSVERTLQDVPILQAYPGWNTLTCVKSNRVYVVDGSAYFSRPGPRLVDSLEVLANALHGEVHPLPHGLPAATRFT